MKNISKILLAAFTLFIVLLSCKKDENKDYFEGGTAPALTASRTGTIPLSFATKDNEAIKLAWTNPDYKFTTGVSSQNVNYLIEIDTTGANFTNPNRQSVAVSQELERTFTDGQFNDYLLNQLVLIPGIPHNIEIRVTSTLGGNAVPLYSDVLKYVVTPYAIPPKVEPPTNGTLWITGDAAPSGWDNPLLPPEDLSQKFTKVSNTLYELTLTMPGGGAYKLIQEQGIWGTQYHMLAGGTWEGGDFEKKDADPGFPGPPAAGNYKIQVDFQRGKFIVKKL
jgi:starch-binding outer membrane protein SusE/F